MRRMILVFLLACGTVFGAYDDSTVERNAGGGWGYFSTDSASANDGLTFIAHGERIAAKDGDVVSKIRMLAKREAVAGANGVKFKIFTYNGTTYPVLHDIDVTAEYNAITISTALPVEKTGSWTLSGAAAGYGYYLGMFMEVVGTGSKWGAKATGSTSTMKYVSGDVPTSILASGLTTFTAGAMISMEAYVNNNDFTSYEVATDAENGALGDGVEVSIPYWMSEAQYVVIEGVSVPDAESLDIEIETMSQTSGAVLTLETISISFDGGANDAKISDDGFVTSKALTGQEGNKQDIYIWLDAVNDEFEVLYQNMIVGSGLGADDRRIFSLSDRAADSMSLTGRTIRRIRFTQPVGTAATIDKVITCRKPVLAVGDSFVGSTSPSSLNHVGAQLGEAFTEERYVINAGIAANKVRENNGASSTALWERWNNPQDNQDLVSFKDVLVVLVNGPGTNDIATIGTSEDSSRLILTGVSGVLGKVVGEALDPDDVFGRTNDIVISELIPRLEDISLENEAVTKLNTEIRGISSLSQVPYASMEGYNSSWYNDLVHPDTEGAEWIADKIADAYENDTIAPATTGGGGKPSILGPTGSILGGN